MRCEFGQQAAGNLMFHVCLGLISLLNNRSGRFNISRSKGSGLGSQNSTFNAERVSMALN